jgi:hypothetical protein
VEVQELPLVKLNPSKVHLLVSCMYRYLKLVQTRKPSNYTYFNIRTFLGIVIHEVIEAYILKKFDLKDFEVFWHNNIQVKLNANGITYPIDYIQYHVPYYAIKKVQTLKLLAGIKLSDQTKPEAIIDSELIYGKIDIVEECQLIKHVTLTDFKTGPIWNLANGCISSIKESYRLQLMTYGLAFWEKGYSAKNIKCIIKGLAPSDEAVFSFSEDNYRIHSKFLIEKRRYINSYVSSGVSQGLATPSTSCRYCEVAQVCKPMHTSVYSGNLEIGSVVVMSKSNCVPDENNLAIRISQHGEARSIQRIPHEILITIQESLSADKMVFIANLLELPDSSILNWTRFTTLSIIDSIE